ESAVAKPHYMIAPGSSRYSSNDMVHNHYLDEAKKKIQESSRNLEPSVLPSARSQSTANGSKPKSKINNQNSRNWPASKSSCVPTGKIFASSTNKVESEPTNGSKDDITNQYECEQTLDVSAGTLNLSAEPGASIRRHTGSYYPKRYWELLPKEILGATTQRDGSYYPKRYWVLLPKERMGCLMGKWMGASCTQRKVSMVPFVFSIPFVLSWGGSISSDSFLPSILLLVDKASSVRLPVANVTLSSSTHLLRENTNSQLVLPELQQYHQQSVTGWQPEKILEFKTSRDRYRDNGVSDPIKGLVFLVSVSSSYSGTGSLSSWSRCVVYLLLSTDEDGDTRMGGSTGVSVSLGGEISSGGKKSQEYDTEDEVALFPTMLDVPAPSTSPSRITTSPSRITSSPSPTPSQSPEPTLAHTPSPTQPSPTQPSPTQPSPTQPSPTQPGPEHQVPTPHDSPLHAVHSHGSDEGSLKLQELMNLVTTLSDRIGVLEADLMKTKKTYSSAYTKLILRVKKLESQIKIGKARKQARVVLSDDEAFEDDSSKQGRKLFDEEVQEKASAKKGTTEEVPIVSTAEVLLSTAGGIVTYTRRSAEKRSRQDKGKAIMIEEEPKKKSKKELEQERLSYAEAIRLEKQMNEKQRAHIARDEEITRQWDEEERQRSMDEAKSTKKIYWNDPSVIRYHTLKMKPKTVDQARKTYMYYQVFRGDGSSKIYKILSEMLKDFDRLDVEELYRLVTERYSASRPEGFDMMLCGDLLTLLAVHMLTEKKYPLSQEMISKMLKKKLEVDHESSQAIKLLSSELRIHDYSNELSSSKLLPKVVPPANKTATSRQELELLFHHHITMLRCGEILGMVNSGGVFSLARNKDIKGTGEVF
ncbi:hypothetical protein Tco_0731920, partial [Tanacetum coccineum]